MKNVVDYLKKNKKFAGVIAGKDIEIKLSGNTIIVEWNDEDRYVKKFHDGHDAENIIQDFLEKYKVEVRFCEVCGKPYDAGFIAGDGDWYCCEGCFEKTMNKDYGKGKWRETDDEGVNGGFYEYLDDNGKWEDTGIYWTDWND